MAHRLAPGAEVELDEIWFWTAKESGSIEIADRLIDSLTERFFMLGRHPHVGRPRDDDLRPGPAKFSRRAVRDHLSRRERRCRDPAYHPRCS